MQVLYCDKCKKKIKKEGKNASIHISGGGYSFLDVVHLCKKCTDKFNKIFKKFFASK